MNHSRITSFVWSVADLPARSPPLMHPFIPTALACALLLAGPVPAGAQTLRLDQVLDLRTFADRQPVDLSPDGALVATPLKRPSEAEGRERLTYAFLRSGVPQQTVGVRVHLVDTESGEARALTPAGTISWGPIWSPDGHYLAYYADVDGTAGLWVWDRERDAARRIMPDIVRPHFGFETPKWCGGSEQLLVKVLPEGMTLTELADRLPRRGARPAREEAGERAPVTVLASDSSLLQVESRAQESDREENEERDTGTIDAGGPDGVSWTNSELADLVVVDVETGQLTRVARRTRSRGYACSPDGRRALLTDMEWAERPGSGGTVVYDLVVVDLATGEERVVARRGLRDYGLTAGWGPEGRRVAWVDADGALVVSGGAAPGTALEKWRELQRFERSGVDFRTDYRPPLWHEDGARIRLLAADTVWDAHLGTGQLTAVGTVPGHDIRGLLPPGEAARSQEGTATVVVRDPETLEMGFARIEGGESELLWRDDVYLGPDFPYHVDAAGGDVVFVAQNSNHPQEVWISDHGLRSARRLSDLHPDISRLPLGESRLVQWTSAKGETLRGVLVLPPGHRPGRSYPTVVLVYPDRRPATAINVFGVEGAGAYNVHLLTSRGYAVFLPAAPFEPGAPLDGLVASVLPGVDRLVELGVSDPDRIGVTGTSAGGYATLGLLVRSDRWAAAIAEQGFGSLFGQYANMRADGTAIGISYVEGYGLGMGASPWEPDMLNAYLENSPLFHLDRVSAPVLLIHGDADGTVSPALSEQVFVALRRLGKPAVLAVYHGEDHGMGRWHPSNIEDYWQRVWRWWDRWLRDGSSP